MPKMLFMIYCIVCLLRTVIKELISYTGVWSGEVKTPKGCHFHTSGKMSVADQTVLTHFPSTSLPSHS